MKFRTLSLKHWHINGLLIIFLVIQAGCNQSVTYDNEVTPSAYQNHTTSTKIPRMPKITPSQTLTPTSQNVNRTQTPIPTNLFAMAINYTLTPTAISPTNLSTILYSKRMEIGESVLGKPIEVYRFGDGSIHRMIVAGIHGGAEMNTIQLADELIQYLPKNSKLVPPGISLFILRSLNPDGETRVIGPEGRANHNGVDLNRNWDAFWQANPDLSGCWSVYTLSTGEFPHSEPETLALIKFLEDFEIDALISYHSAGQGIYAGGQPADPDSDQLAERLSEISGYPYPPIDAGCVYTGQLIDWAVGRDIAAVDVELPNKWETQFETNLKLLEAFLRWER